jgi:flagellar hook-associated protein 2
MRSEQSTLQQQNGAFANINTQLTTFQANVKALADPTLFDSRLAQTSDATIASTTAAAGAPVGSYLFSFTQLATAAKQLGTTDLGKTLSASNDVSGLVLSDAGFSTSITAGTITVNGKQITVATSDTLQAVFDNISTATGGAVTGSYDPAADKITLTSDSEIVLGSTTDTSNFLQATKLYNSGTGSVTSASGLGGVKLIGNIAASNLATTVVDDGSGTGSGQFKINGVSISYNVNNDSIQNVLDRINNSTAGVTASYDTSKDQFVLTNKSTGDVGIALEDTTGNLLGALGLTGGTLERGKNLLYSINNGDQLTSQSNTVDGTSSGLTGLSVTALKDQSSVTVTVSNDTNKIQSAINDFLTEYNNVQNLIDTQTASSTDSQGKVTAGVLAGDSEANEIASKLRSLAYTPASSSGLSINNLADLGIDSNGNDNTFKLSDATKLDDALQNNLAAVKQLFTDSTNGLAVNLNTYITQTTSDTGVLATKQANLTQQSADIDTQVADLERRLTDEQQSLTNSFVAMETAQANINQQLQYLSKNFGTSSTTAG